MMLNRRQLLVQAGWTAGGGAAALMLWPIEEPHTLEMPFVFDNTQVARG